MTASPMILSSHISCDCATPNGSAATTVKICSVERNSVSVPPMAIRLVEAKKAVPFCSAAVTWASTMRISRASSRSIHSSR